MSTLLSTNAKPCSTRERLLHLLLQILDWGGGRRWKIIRYVGSSVASRVLIPTTRVGSVECVLHDGLCRSAPERKEHTPLGLIEINRRRRTSRASFHIQMILPLPLPAVVVVLFFFFGMETSLIFYSIFLIFDAPLADYNTKDDEEEAAIFTWCSRKENPILHSTVL